MKTSKQELIEILGVHLEGEHKVPPLAARIYAILILTAEEGLTFEDFLERSGASKSSVSTSLNLLLSMEIISYFTKHGDRRRFFSIKKDKNYFLTKMKENLKRLETEKNIIDLMEEFLGCHHPEKLKASKDKAVIYRDFVNRSKDLLQETIKKLETLEVQ